MVYLPPYSSGKGMSKIRKHFLFPFISSSLQWHCFKQDILNLFQHYKFKVNKKKQSTLSLVTNDKTMNFSLKKQLI